jgi:AraC-like DNA-binding protein/mannose-6-phosphate isomerase-like protein (cupin superfamily)
MRRTDRNLSETDIRPDNAVVTLVRADSADSRPWLADAPVCPALSHYHIRHVAVATMQAPFRIVRTQLAGSYFLACLGGEGRVLVDGRWMRCRPGQAVLLPPNTRQAFHAIPQQPWDICWVRYREPAGQRPLAATATPIVAKYDAAALQLAIRGLHHEASTDRGPAAMEHWVDLIHHYVRRFAEPAQTDPRLWNLWRDVAASLDQPWTIAGMAKRVHLSEKQLQRLCRKELGRNPRQQLIWLRMRRAAELLVAPHTKIETIANQVGYQNPFVFSTTFKRVMGWSPSQFPGRKE